MCGIVYANNFKGSPVNKQVIERYKAQRTRGINGFGFFVPEANRLTHNTREGRILSLLGRREDSEVLFHHRFPTSTENVRNACHPFSTLSNNKHFTNNYVLVHNGHVSNASALKAKHEEIGIEYVSTQPTGEFNDSEALLYDVALYLDGQQDKLTATGGIAFIVIERNKEGERVKVHFGRNSSPLKMTFNEDELVLASEGDGEMIKSDVLHSFNYKTGALESIALEIPSGWADYGYTYSNSQYNSKSLGEWDSGVRDNGDYDYNGYSRDTLSEIDIDAKVEYYLEAAEGDVDEAYAMATDDGAELATMYKILEQQLMFPETTTEDDADFILDECLECEDALKLTTRAITRLFWRSTSGRDIKEAMTVADIVGGSHAN